MSPWALLILQDETLRDFFLAYEDLKTNALIAIASDGKLSLTDKGRGALPEQAVKAEADFNHQCRGCAGRGYSIPLNSEKLLATFKQLMTRRPPPSEKFDQTSITAEDAFVRVGFFHERGDLVNKELLMVGDFDCLSVVAALTGLPKRVVVVEYDDRLVNFLNEIAAELHLNLKAHKFDVRAAFPAELTKSFDVFSCDPVETLEGIKLYIARGVTGLKGVGCSGYIGLTSLEASKKKWFDIEKIFFEMNFAITDLRRNFNAYPDTGLEEMHPFYQKIGVAPDCTWYWAALVRIEAVEVPNIPILGEYTGPDDIYVDDEAWATPVWEEHEKAKAKAAQ